MDNSLLSRYNMVCHFGKRCFMKAKTHEISLTDGNLFVKLLRVSTPLILSTLLQLLYNAADLIVCGQFGSSHSVAAISATSSLINLYIQLLVGLSVGANVLMSRCYGAGDREHGQKVVYTSMVFALGAGLAIGIIGATTSHLFLALMDTPEEIIGLSTSYLVIYFCGLPFAMIYNFGASIMRATGDTKRPFYFLSAAGIVNVLLNLFFVIVCKMDVAGVALATSISQGISALCVIIALLKNNGFFRFSFREIRFHGSVAKEIASSASLPGYRECSSPSPMSCSRAASTGSVPPSWTGTAPPRRWRASSMRQ